MSRGVRSLPMLLGALFLGLTLQLGAVSASINREPLTMSYYDLLGVPRDATKSQMKRRYRKLALEHHPDKVKGEEAKKLAKEKFVVISHGYDVITNETLRERYEELLSKGIFEYDDEEWEERQLRKTGWKSPMEIDLAERRFLFVCAVCIVGFVIWLVQYYIKKMIADEKRAKKQKANRIAKMEKEMAKRTDTKRVVSAAQMEVLRKNYQKALKIYHKQVKAVLRTSIQDHGVWLAPKFSEDDISVLCAVLPVNEMITCTRQLCEAQGTSPAYPPLAPSDEDKELDKASYSELERKSARQILKELSVRVGSLSAAYAKKMAERKKETDDDEPKQAKKGKKGKKGKKEKRS